MREYLSIGGRSLDLEKQSFLTRYTFDQQSEQNAANHTILCLLGEPLPLVNALRESYGASGRNQKSHSRGNYERAEDEDANLAQRRNQSWEGGADAGAKVGRSSRCQTNRRLVQRGQRNRQNKGKCTNAARRLT